VTVSLLPVRPHAVCLRQAAGCTDHGIVACGDARIVGKGPVAQIEIFQCGPTVGFPQ
jgi:hypothetical protein